MSSTFPPKSISKNPTNHHHCFSVLLLSSSLLYQIIVSLLCTNGPVVVQSLGYYRQPPLITAVAGFGGRTTNRYLGRRLLRIPEAKPSPPLSYAQKRIPIVPDAPFDRFNAAPAALRVTFDVVNYRHWCAARPSFCQHPRYQMAMNDRPLVDCPYSPKEEKTLRGIELRALNEWNSLFSPRPCDQILSNTFAAGRFAGGGYHPGIWRNHHYPGRSMIYKK